jgi:hypothetical protein
MGALPAGIAIATEKLRHLRLQGDLEEEADAEPGYFLENLAKFPARVEQLVELSPEPLAGRYSS